MDSHALTDIGFQGVEYFRVTCHAQVAQEDRIFALELLIHVFVADDDAFAASP
jgi:hypothetical protein